MSDQYRGIYQQPLTTKHHLTAHSKSYQRYPNRLNLQFFGPSDSSCTSNVANHRRIPHPNDINPLIAYRIRSKFSLRLSSAATSLTTPRATFRPKHYSTRTTHRSATRFNHGNYSNADSW